MKKAILNMIIVEILLFAVAVHSETYSRFHGYFSAWAFIICSGINFVCSVALGFLKDLNKSNQGKKKRIDSTDATGVAEDGYDEMNRKIDGVLIRIAKYMVILLILYGVYSALKSQFARTINSYLKGDSKENILWVLEFEWANLWKKLNHLSYIIAGGVFVIYFLYHSLLSDDGSISPKGGSSGSSGRPVGGTSRSAEISRSNFYAGRNSTSGRAGGRNGSHRNGYGGGNGGGGSKFGGGAGRGRH